MTDSTTLPDINRCREDIDAIDRAILSLFEQRMQVSRDVAAYKYAHHKEVLDPEREAKVLQDRSQAVRDPLLRQPAMQLFTEIMRLSREEQYRFLEARLASTQVGYNGIPGAFSESAALLFFGEDCRRVPFRTFDEIFAAVASDEIRYGVVPVENSTSGPIIDAYDLLGRYACHIVGEVLVPVSHCLLVRPGTTMEDITTVYSHPQGFTQCQAFLSGHPGWRQVPYFNTAISAQHVARSEEPGLAAIASELAAREYGLAVLQPNIEDVKGNRTRFVVVAASPRPLGLPDKATLTFTLKDERGTLQRALSSFVALGMNLSHIESRPLPGNRWQYRFYVDLTGNITPESLNVLVRCLAVDCTSCRVLGSYQAAREV